MRAGVGANREQFRPWVPRSPIAHPASSSRSANKTPHNRNNSASYAIDVGNGASKARRILASRGRSNAANCGAFARRVELIVEISDYIKSATIECNQFDYTPAARRALWANTPAASSSGLAPARRPPHPSPLAYHSPRLVYRLASPLSTRTTPAPSGLASLGGVRQFTTVARRQLISPLQPGRASALASLA